MDDAQDIRSLTGLLKVSKIGHLLAVDHHDMDTFVDSSSGFVSSDLFWIRCLGFSFGAQCFIRQGCHSPRSVPELASEPRH